MRYIILICIGLFFLDVFYFQKKLNAQTTEWNQAFDDAREEVLFCGNPETVGYYLGAKYNLFPITAGMTFDIISNTYRLTVFAANPDFTTIAILTQYDDVICLTSLSVGHKKMDLPQRNYK